MHPSNWVTLENVNNVVRYHRPNADQSRRHEALSAATEKFITALLEHCPDCEDRTSAIRHARVAKMEASAAIALEEDHEPAHAPETTAPEVSVTAGHGQTAFDSPADIPQGANAPAPGVAVSASTTPPGALQPPPREEPPTSHEPAATPTAESTAKTES